MGQINGRYKHCIDDNCPNKNERHYHKYGKICKLPSYMKYCSKCGEYKYIWYEHTKIFNYEFNRILYYKHCQYCHKLYDKDIKHICGTDDNENMPDFYCHCKKCNMLYEKNYWLHECYKDDNAHHIDNNIIQIDNLLTYALNKDLLTTNIAKFSPIEKT